jgi:hypothetical protein
VARHRRHDVERRQVERLTQKAAARLASGELSFRITRKPEIGPGVWQRLFEIARRAGWAWSETPGEVLFFRTP